MLLCLAVIVPSHWASATGSQFGVPNSQGVFDITATVPEGHGNGFFEMSLDPAFGAAVTTKAGTPGTSGFAEGSSSTALFNNPGAVARDSLGNLFVADNGNNCIRMVSPTGVVSTIAGSSAGVFGYADGIGFNARFAFPSGVAVGPADGNVYVADTYNNRVRKLTRPLVPGEPWMVTTLAGSGIAGFFDASGTAARFSSPQGLVVDAAGNVYVADAANNRIRKVTPTGGVTTLAGAGAAGFLDGLVSVAKFDSPYGVVLDSLGNLLVADRGNHRIRKITPGGVVSTFAGSGALGSGDGAALGATFRFPVALAIDAYDTLYVSDEQNHMVRRVTSFGTVATVAGSGTAGFTNGRAGSAQFNYPAGLAVDASGNIVVADSENDCLRLIAAEVSVAAETNGAVSPPSGELAVKATISPAALGLAIGTYYFRWRAGDWTVQNDGLNKFITTVVPVVTTVAASPVNAGEATFNATVNPRNLTVTSVRFQYATDPAFASPLEVSVTPLPGNGSADVPVSYQLSYPTSTLPGTVYYFRAVAQNDYGTATATDILSFTVPQTALVTDAATNITRTSAQLNATVDPKGSATTVTFEYSTQPGLIDSWLVSTAVAAPNVSNARGLAVDASGNTFYSLRDTHQIAQSPSGPSIGSSTRGFTNGSFANASFDHPAGVALYNPNGATKVLYVGDEHNHCVRKIDLLTGTVTTFAGSGIAGFTDDAAATARFLYPTGVAVDATGNVYVADTGNHSIRKITVVAGVATTVATIAGTGIAGQADGLGTTAQFRSPLALATSSDGSVYVADTGNHRICKISTTNVVSVVAGGGAAGFLDDDDTDPATGALFSSPGGITIDSTDVIYVADRGNHRVRRITADGRVTTIAGSGVVGLVDSPASGSGLIPGSATQFSSPNAIACDSSGNVFVTEDGNLDIRKIVPGTIKTVTVTPDVFTTGNQPVSKDTLVLSPGTTYYYRAIGDNRLDGTFQGEILSFTTYTEPAIVVYDGGSTSSPALSQPQVDVIDYGTRARATVITREFTIANAGGWPLAVSAISVPGGYARTGGLGSILPGSSATFSVAFTTTAVGIYNGDVVITNDDPTKTSFSFPIKGKKVDPPIIRSVELKDLTLMPTGVTLVADVDPNGADTTFEFEVSPGPDFEGVRVTTLAGATTGYADGTGVDAQFNLPQGMATDATGNIYVADTLNHRIRKISSSGAVTTVAGTGDAGFVDGPSATAQFDGPTGIAIGADGTIYVADSNNRRIRAISTADVVSTYSGTGLSGFTDGVVAGARFEKPLGLAIDSAGILYVADRDNQRVRKVAQDGSVSTLANFGGASAPTAVTVGTDGTVYVADAGDHVIRKVTAAGVVTTLAGSGAIGSANGIGTLASFTTPIGILLDEEAGKIYVADQAVHTIRKITLDGTVSTLAGSGTQGVADGLGHLAQFDSPLSLALLRTKVVIVGETGGSTIRQITPTVIKVPASDVVTTAGKISLQVTGLDPNIIYYFRAIAISVGGSVVSDAPLIGTAFTQWQIDNFGANAVNPLIAGPDASPAKDHVPNLLKYALGLDPNARALSGLPILRFDHPSPGFFSLTIHRNPAAPNVRYFFEGSTDQINWTSNDVLLSGDSIGYLPYKDVTRRFLRLGVELVLP